MNRKKIAFYLFLFVIILGAVPAEATDKARKQPDFKTAEQEKSYRLRNGEILTDGGYLGHAVWGDIEAVVQASPDKLWKIYIRTNHWNEYHFPTMLDSRAMNSELAEFLAKTHKVEDVYKAVGDRVIPEEENRQVGGIWTSYPFQYYDVPWPVANRWMILKNTNDETRAKEGIYCSEWTKAAGNVKTINGNITFEPFEGNPRLSLMKYHVESDPGASVPRFLVKWGVRSTMPAVVKVIRREARKEYGPPMPVLEKAQ